MTATIEIDEETYNGFLAIAEPGEDFAAFVAAAALKALARREYQAAGRAEMQAMLDGPRHRFDAEGTYRSYCEKYGWPDLSHLSREEIEERWDALMDAAPPEKALMRTGWHPHEQRTRRADPVCRR